MGIFSFFRKQQNLSQSDEQLFSFVSTVLGKYPSTLKIYITAITHQSHADKHQLGYNYERLEFLGDAVLDMSISEHLYHLYPEKNEGDLTKLRSAIVNRNSLNQLAKKIGLNNFIRTEVNLKTPGLSLPGNVLEAFIGAIYIDKGYTDANNFIIEKLINPYVSLDSLEEKFENYKSTLLEWSQKESSKVEINVSNLETEKGFKAVILVDAKEMGTGTGRSKKIAEQEASLEALEKLNLR